MSAGLAYGRLALACNFEITREQRAMTIIGRLINLVGATAPSLDSLVSSAIADPLLNAAKYLIPAFVAIAGIHKLMEHRESGGAFLIEMIVKGGGAFLVISLVQAFVPHGGG